MKSLFENIVDLQPLKTNSDKFQYDPKIEIADDEWIYELLPDYKKGKKLRKYFQKLYYGDDVRYWRPKLDDLSYCEEKRWKSVQYREKQRNKIEYVFDKILKSLPFCCIRMTEEHPGYAWVVFNKISKDSFDWEWWDFSDEKKKEKKVRPECEVKQNLGDLYFNNEERNRTISRRVYYFQKLFEMSLFKRYENEFYENKRDYNYIKKRLVINGRDYLIGDLERSFGVIAYPEDMVTEYVKPGPICKPLFTNL